MNIKAINVNGQNYNICSSFIEIKNLGDYSIECVDSLPTTSAENTLYLMKTSSIHTLTNPRLMMIFGLQNIQPKSLLLEEILPFGSFHPIRSQKTFIKVH